MLTMSRGSRHQEGLGATMNGSWASMFLLFFALLGCHADHHVSSKNKYKQMEAKSQTKVEVKEIDDKDSYVNWDKDSGESFLVQKVWWRILF